MATGRSPRTIKSRSTRREAIPPKLLAKVRALCLALPDAREEMAWAGIRWMIGKRNFAHLVRIDEGWPPAYARAAGSDGPLVVLTIRASPELRDVLHDAAPRFFHAPWGTRWGTQVVGIKLEGAIDWKELRMLVGESYRLLAPRPRAAAPRKRTVRRT